MVLGDVEFFILPAAELALELVDFGVLDLEPGHEDVLTLLDGKSMSPAWPHDKTWHVITVLRFRGRGVLKREAKRCEKTSPRGGVRSSTCFALLSPFDLSR